MKKLLTVLLSLMMIFALVGCSSSSKETKPAVANDGSIEVVVVTAPVGMHPLKTNDSASTYITGQIFETLYQRTLDGSSYEPELAASMPEYSEDGLTATIHLREGVKFHNGDDFTADAVAYMIDCLKDKEYGSQRPSIVASIDSYEIVDPLTIQLNLKYTDGILVASLAHTNGAIVNPNLDKDQDFLVDPTGAGTGPYKFVSAIPGSTYVLEANEEYWGGAPEVKKATFSVVPDETSAVARMQTGEADFMPGVGSDSFKTVEAIPGVTAVSKPNSSIYYIANRSDDTAKNDLMTNPEFRKALFQAVDYENFVTSYFQGNASFSKSIIGPTLVGYDASMNDSYTEFNPEEAKATIEANGWTGQEITFLCSNREAHMQLAAFIQDSLSKVGITVSVVSEEWATFLADAKTDEYFDFVVLSWSNVTGDGHQMISPNFETKNDTRVKYQSAEFDSYCDAAAKSTDIAVRTEAMKSAVALIQGVDFVAEPVYSINTMYAFGPKLASVAFDASSLFYLNQFTLSK